MNPSKWVCYESTINFMFQFSSRCWMVRIVNSRVKITTEVSFLRVFVLGRPTSACHLQFLHIISGVESGFVQGHWNKRQNLSCTFIGANVLDEFHVFTRTEFGHGCHLVRCQLHHLSSSSPDKDMKFKSVFEPGMPTKILYPFKPVIADLFLRLPVFGILVNCILKLQLPYNYFQRSSLGYCI